MSSAECAPELSAYELLPRREKLTLETTDVSCPFNDGDLETKTYTQVWDFLFSSPLGSRDHTLGTSQSETTGNDDTPGISFRLLNSVPELTWRNKELSRHCGIELGLALTFLFRALTSLPTISLDLPFHESTSKDEIDRVKVPPIKTWRFVGNDCFGLVAHGMGNERDVMTSRTWRSNFCPHRIDACSRALTTLM
jgi:hypothetical protein